MKKVLLIIFLLALTVISENANAITAFVTPSGAGLQDGTSWLNAFSGSQFKTQIDLAATGTDFWVASGTYYPGISGATTASFVMKNGVALYGGFVGGESLLSARNPAANVTILSGDLDLSTTFTSLDAYHVVYSTGNNNTAIIDGFTISGGNCTLGFPNGGGGIYITLGNPVINQCKIINNYAYIFGGGIYGENGGNATITRCLFSANICDNFGGAMRLDASSPIITNCIFRDNVGYSSGIESQSASIPTITNCTFYNNSAGSGLGILRQSNGSDAIVKNCIFWNNNDPDIVDASSSTTVIFSDLQTPWTGAGSNNISSNPLFSNAQLELSNCSPALNAGTNTGAPSLDYGGNSRPFSTTVDMGAWEYQSAYVPLPSISISGNQTICSGSSTLLTASGASNYTWSPYQLPLDINGGSTLAIGLRKLKGAYLGNALRLRRSSDNAEMDFGFAGNDLDVSAIATWLGGADGYCTILYDQSGAGNNVTQATAANQPLFVAGALSGKPVLRFNSSQWMNNSINYTSPYSVIYGAKQTGPSRTRVLSSKSNNWLLGWWNGAKGQAYYEGWLNLLPGTPAADNSYYVYSGISNGTTSQIYENSTLLFSNSGGVAGPNGIQLNGYQNGTSETSDCDFTDVMIFSSVLSNNDRTSIESNTSNYYSTTFSQITVSPTTSTTYTVTGFNTPGCSSTASITINVNSLPVITCPSNISQTLTTGLCQTIVNYPNATATGNTPISISYSQNSGTSFSSGSHTVTVTATDVNGCTSSCSFIVNVIDAELPTINCSANVTVNAATGQCSQTVVLTNPTTSDNCGLSVPVLDKSVTDQSNGSSWYTNGSYVGQSFIAGGTATLGKISLEFDGAGTGSIEIRQGYDICGPLLYTGPAVFNLGWNDYTITGVNVTAGNPYTIVIYPSNGTVVKTGNPHPGENIYWYYCGNGGGFTALHFKTYLNAVPLYNNHNSSTYPIGNTSVIWTVTDVNGNSNTCVQNVTVVENIPPTISCASNITICEGLNVVLGTPTTTDNCGPITVTNDAPGIFVPGTINVTWTATDLSGNTATCVQQVTVLSKPTVTITASPSTTVCAGQSITLSGNGASSYVWSGGISNGISFVPGASGVYTVTGTSANGCTNTSTVSVSVGVVPTASISAGGATTVCSPATVALNMTGSNATSYLWSNGATSANIVVTSSGTYSAQVFGTLGCSVTTNSIAVTVNTPSGNPAIFGLNQWNVYAWNAGGNTNTGSSWNTNYSGYYIDTTTYGFNTLSRWSNGGSPSDASGFIGCPVGVDNHSWSAKRQGFPCGYYTINIVGHDDQGELYIDGSMVWQHIGCCDAHNSVWSGFLSSTSQVEFRVTEGVGGSNGTLTIVPVSFGITASGTILCNNNTVSLQATVLSGTYLWAPGGQTTSGITTQTSGTYTVSLTGATGCTLTSSITLTDVPPPTITTSGNVTVCSGTPATLTASGASTFTWSTATGNAIDGIGSAQLAVGLRKLKTGYAGYALQLRRSSDNDTLSFGFTGNDLDATSIATWLGGADGFCSILYDQSGSGNHVTQANTANQPKYIASGINGKPILRFNTSQYMYNNTNFTPPYSVVYGAKQTGPTRERVLASRTNNWLLGWWGSRKSVAHFEGWVSTSSPFADYGSYIYSATGDGLSSQFYANGALLNSNSYGLAGPNGIQLNGWQGLNEMSDCEFMDVTIFNSVLSNSNRSQIENSIGNYYNIPVGGNINPLVVNPTSTTIYTVTGTDGNGCTGTTSVTVSVNPQPVITCPGNVSTTLASGVCSAVMTYPPAIATGNNPIVITYSQNSGTSFPSGTTVVTATATDANGCTSTCTFNVNVIDVTAPVISCPTSVTVNNDPGICGAVVNLSATASDDCPALGITSATYNYTGAIQTFVVPSGCTSIHLTALGAAGGNYNNNAILGGKGASMSGDFATTPGETLYILVGQQGGSSNSYYNGGGGGGGTFISRDPAMITNLVLAAGGGGGGGSFGTSDANTTTNGNSGGNGGYYGTANGGTNGNGGQGWVGGGGAGWNNDGGEYECGNRGHAPRNGGAGGNSCSGANGGYGGGGGNNSGAGGGGGYSGGGSGDYDYNNIPGIGAGGGGSFNTGTNQINLAGVGSSNGQVVINYTIQYPIVNVTTGVQPGGVFPVGTTTNIWTATDAAGNTSTCSATITVIDTEAPVISCPANYTVNNDLGQCSAVVNYAIPAIVDNCCPVPTSLAGHTYIGTYGNHSYFKSNNTVSNFNDAKNAAIAAGGHLACINSAGENAFIAANVGGDGPYIGGFQNHSNPNYSEPNGGWEWVDGSPFTFTSWNSGEPNNVGGEDFIQIQPGGGWNDMCYCANKYIVEIECGLTPTLVSGPASGGTFSLGTTTVSYMATDGTGLTSTCSFTITVVDNEAPVITSCGPTQSVATNGSCQGVVPDFTSGVVVTDNCTAVNSLIKTQSPLAGILKDKGSYTVTLTVTDAAGNSSTCTTTLNVVDNVAPVINCTSGITVNNAPGTCSAVVNFSAPTFTDNCSDININGTQTYNYTGSPQTFTVPSGVTSIHIDARGAQGGGYAAANTGGLGARIAGDFTVIPGSVIDISVGQSGALGSIGGGGGGGGSGAKQGATFLLVAGGGGGAGWGNNGVNASTSTSGTATSNGGIAGGTGGNGGNAVSNNGGGCAGGGILSAGAKPPGGTPNTAGTGGFNALGGLNSGNYCNGSSGAGGAGVGGGGGGESQRGGGGGGGGYSGGAGGYWSDGGWCSTGVGFGGGGGGSYNVGINQTNTAGIQTGNGQLTITYSIISLSTITQTSGLPSGSTFPIGNSVITWTATDGSGNTSTCTQIITVADTRPPVVITPSGNTNFCPGGSVTLTAEAGLSPYLWSTGSTSQAITVSATGNYVVTATEQNGCTKSGSIQVTVTPIGKTQVVTNVTCKGGSNGSITVTGTGGIGAPYTYLWGNGNSSNTRSNLTSGSYSVTITDGAGCSALFYISVNQPASGIIVNLSKTNIRCAGGSSGSITATPTGGTAPYSYLWNNGTTTDVNSSLTVGTYTVTVSDVNGCVSTKSTSLTTNPALVVVISFGPAPSTSTASASGGVPAYTYLWNTVPSQTNATATGLIAGHNYKVKVTDSKNCTKLILVTMPTPKLNSEGGLEVSLYPNPTDGIVTLNYNSSQSDKFNVNVFDLTGRMVFSNTENKSTGLFSKVYDFSRFAKGVYNIQILTDHGNKLIKLVID